MTTRTMVIFSLLLGTGACVQPQETQPPPLPAAQPLGTKAAPTTQSAPKPGTIPAPPASCPAPQPESRVQHLIAPTACKELVYADLVPHPRGVLLKVACLDNDGAPVLFYGPRSETSLNDGPWHQIKYVFLAPQPVKASLKTGRQEK